VGDLALWLAGRVAGHRVLEWDWVRRRLPVQGLERVGRWLDRNLAGAVVAARFLPGTRLPLYLGTGILGRQGGRFVLWSFVAALLWTPLRSTFGTGCSRETLARTTSPVRSASKGCSGCTAVTRWCSCGAIGLPVSGSCDSTRRGSLRSSDVGDLLTLAWRVKGTAGRPRRQRDMASSSPEVPCGLSLGPPATRRAAEPCIEPW
jgi:hypothetical protein